MLQEKKDKIESMLPFLNESQIRKYLASEAIELGRGGIKIISSISGVHRNTISSSIKELKLGNGINNSEQKKGPNDKIRIRAKGGGRKSLLEKQPGLLDALDRLVDPASYGDPMRLSTLSKFVHFLLVRTVHKI